MSERKLQCSITDSVNVTSRGFVHQYTVCGRFATLRHCFVTCDEFREGRDCR